ncbi:poly-gamma-glutamate biosynthesis protein PgsC [Sedimentibacter hydroxybenzoicus DSM 7310]|uniref:Poly-gamma-glutamate biosynthesis protein PgsC n=1 Tax=Sedimentibacter hydroxybenzoicus DSM 7310 TaxID=1123245 RepID=A0A974GVQ2_SEDHY|nr:poly-gamma-glutamate biosynthesis protein PgsC [Sedimentibacter hydroxybenzoicus]NYB73642.1 poly-gamma-glutamate biosynthesis protein PgsC [Sedimentibacter hydroxybenzoicus DSM 7310]
MQLTDISTVIVLSVILSLLFTEITGILPAGLVVPGYLTLLMKTPQAILMTLIISVLTYLIVFFGISKVTILYGKRKFIAMIIVAILLQFIIRTVVPIDYIYIAGLGAVGIVVPGLLANTVQRQGLAATFLSTGLLIAVTYGCTILLNIKIV